MGKFVGLGYVSGFAWSMDDHVRGIREASLGVYFEKKNPFFVMMNACLRCEKRR
jgi:hypothetical protein